MIGASAPMGDTSFLATALNDPSKHAEVYKYVEALKGDEQGWRKSIERILGDNLSSPEEYFIMLQVIEDYVNTRYATGDEAASNTVRQLLSHLVNRLLREHLPPFLLNKMAQVFALVFAVDFPTRWPQFVQEVFLTGDLDNTNFAMFYLKFLLSVDTEVVDRDIQRSPELFDRNTKIKDGMRDLCIVECVKSWHHILTHSSDSTVQSLCLEAIAVYVDWVNIELVANDDFVPLLVQRLAHKETTLAAQHAVAAVVGKKMPGDKKLALVSALVDVMHSNGLLDIQTDSDEEDLQRIACLLSALGLAFIDCYTRLNKEDEKASLSALSLLERETPTILRLLAADEETSMGIADLVKAYSGLLLMRGTMDANGVLAQIVATCMQRYEFPDELDIDGTGEEEAEFLEYRKELRTIMHNITSKKPEMLVEPLERAVELVENGSLGVKNKEAIVHLVYSLSELLPNRLLNPKGGIMERAARLPGRVVQLLSPDSPSSSLTLLFFETASRYEKLIGRESRALLDLLPHYIGPSGMNHAKSAVRSRVIYLFSRYVKANRALLSGVVGDVIVRVAPLLASVPSASPALLSNEDHGFLLEAVGTLIVHGQLATETKAQYMTELATTIGSRFEQCVGGLDGAMASGDEKAKESAEEAVTATISFATKLSKSFDLSGKEKSMAACGCTEMFLGLLNLFSSKLTPERAAIAEPLRQYAGRLVFCLDADIFPSLASLFHQLAACAVDADSMQHLVLLAHQVVTKHGKSVPSSGLSLSALLSAAARLSSSSLPSSAPDASRRALTYLRRSFLSLLLLLVQQDILSMVVDDLWSDALGSALVDCSCSLAVDVDPTTQKAAVSVLAKAASWGGVEMKVLQTVLSVPLVPHFSLTDAASILVIHEVAQCLQSAFSRDPTSLSALISTLFPSDFAQQMITALATLNGKDLDRALTLLYTHIRDS